MEQFKNLEKTAGPLFTKTGLLNFGETNDPYLQKYSQIVNDAGYPISFLNSNEIATLYPMMSYPKEWSAVEDPNGGILLAHKCLTAVQQEFKRLGGKIIDEVKVLSIKPVQDSTCVNLRTNNHLGQLSSMNFKKVVICCGGWSSKLIPSLQSLLKTEIIPVTYWKKKEENNKTNNNFDVANKCPIIFNARLTNIYVFPAYEYPGLVKILYHGGPTGDADCPDQSNVDEFITCVGDYVKTHFPHLDHSKPAVLERCIYTTTPDNKPIMDIIYSGKEGSAVIIGTGYSGSGFKHSPCSGLYLATLAVGKERMKNSISTTLDPQIFPGNPYALNRFNLQNSKL